MIFSTQLKGIPCKVEVINIQAAEPIQQYGPGYYDVTPPSSMEFEFTLLDRKGYRAEWLDQHLSSQDVSRITQEVIDALIANNPD